MVRDCSHTSREDGQRLQTYFRRWSETADILQEMVRDCRNTSVDGKRLQSYYQRRSETSDILQKMVRDCRHASRN
ncbi:unnamed protein product, partial [Staurois parvus]